MTTENGTPSSLPDGDAWLDGLAGRGGASESAKDGARLREALKLGPHESVQAAGHAWKDIVAKAGDPVRVLAAGAAPEAANQGRWRQAVGSGFVVLALLLAGGVWIATHSDSDMPGGMRGAPSPDGAVWRTESPGPAAADLAARLGSAGARVKITPQDRGVLLTVECDAVVCPAVDAHLAPLDMAVNAQGRLTLQVLPPR